MIGVEPMTSSLSGTRSNQLSYMPIPGWTAGRLGTRSQQLSFCPHGARPARGELFFSILKP